MQSLEHGQLAACEATSAPSMAVSTWLASRSISESNDFQTMAFGSHQRILPEMVARKVWILCLMQHGSRVVDNVSGLGHIRGLYILGYELPLQIKHLLAYSPNSLDQSMPL